jgi:hypothetical protein
MIFFERILPWAMRHSGALLIGLIWITITVAMAICAALAVGRATAPMTQEATRRPLGPASTLRQVRTPSTVATLALLATFITSYIALMVAGEAFAYYDDSFFSLITLKGHNIQLSVSPEGGRFQPLQYQEFNLVRHFTDTITGYQMVPIVQLLIISVILLLIDGKISIPARVALLILILVTPSICASFISLPPSERPVLLFLLCFALAIKRFEQTQSIASAMSVVIFAQLMMYYKEPVFLLVLGFAVSRLMLRCAAPHVDLGRLWVRESRLDLVLVFLAALFLIFYFAVMGIPGNMNYAVRARLPRSDVVLGYIRVDLLPWLLIGVLLARIYLILRHRVASSPLWDGLAAGSVAYFFAYIYLSMFRVHYPAPVDLIAVLYVGRFAVLSWKKVPLWGKLAATALVLIIVCQEVLVSSFVIMETKNVIQGKVRIASAVQAQYSGDPEKSIRLFFPFAGDYVIMEFGAYLSSLGVPVEGATDESGPNAVVLTGASRGSAKDGPCVEWRSITCHFAPGPAPGDLVIVLPDDEASLAKVSAYRDKGVVLLYSEPRLPILHWLHSLFDSLPVGPQGAFRYDPLPDRWMDASVTKWQ